MKRTEIVIGALVFKTKKSALDHFKKRLKEAPLGNVNDSSLNTELLPLIQRHPEATKKIGAGVLRFFVHNNEGMDGKGFGFVRSDGSATRFSYKKCIHGKDVDEETKLLAACRRAVSLDCCNARMRYFAECEVSGIAPTCEASGLPISFDDSTIDHIPPLSFRVIVHCFKHDNQEMISNPSLLTDGEDQSLGYEFTNKKDARAFREFHARVTDGYLRIVSKEENSKESKSGRLNRQSGTIRVFIKTDQ